MNLEQATRWRNWIGKAGALFCAIFLLAALDGLISQMRQPQNLVELLPGESVDVNGALSENISGIDALEYQSSSELVTLQFEAVHSGFWLGGQMWRGKLTADPHILPGSYHVTVMRKAQPFTQPTTKPSAVFKITVHADHDSYRRSALSLAWRYLDVSPWWVFTVFLLATALVLGAVYFLSHRREGLLAQEGKAEVYHIRIKESEYEIAFGLGRVHGVHPGARLPLLNERGIPIGHVEVRDVAQADSTGSVSLDCPIKTGTMVSCK